MNNIVLTRLEAAIESARQKCLPPDIVTSTDLPTAETAGFISAHVSSGGRILEIGCGTGYFTDIFFSPFAAETVAIDIDPLAIEMAAFEQRPRAPAGRTDLWGGDRLKHIRPNARWSNQGRDEGQPPTQNLRIGCSS